MDNGRPGSIDYGFLNFTLANQLVHQNKMYIYYSARPQKQHWYGRLEWQTPIPDPARERGLSDYQALREVLGRYPRCDNSIGVLIMREDGWAELKPSYERGQVITRQFVFEGDTLKVNAHAYGGYVRVEVLDPNFKAYDGFSAEECDPVFSDDPKQIWHTVRWQGNSDVRSLWNKPCRLCFHLHQASLYAFQFEEEPYDSRSY